MAHPDEQAEQIRTELEEEEHGKRRKKYPECEKLSSSRNEMLTIERFLDWCMGKGVWLAERDKNFENFWIADQAHLLFEYFEIDSKRLEEERRQMLDEQCAANERAK
jgi:hypothetical protein